MKVGRRCPCIAVSQSHWWEASGFLVAQGSAQSCAGEFGSGVVARCEGLCRVESPGWCSGNS